MLGKRDALILTMAGYSLHFGKAYIFPSQDQLRRQAEARWGEPMSKRTVNRYLTALAEEEYFKRVNRCHFINENNKKFKTTLYKLSGKLFGHVKSLEKRISNLSKFMRCPEWLRRKKQSEKDKASKNNNRVPFMASHNPRDKEFEAFELLYGVGIRGFSPEELQKWGIVAHGPPLKA